MPFFARYKERREVQRQLRQHMIAVDDRVVFLKPRLMRRVIRGLTGHGRFEHLNPHSGHFVCSKLKLQDFVRPDEMEDRERLLPDKVILLPLPEGSLCERLGMNELLVRSWRGLFHAHVQMALKTLCTGGHGESFDDLRSAIGDEAFEEIRAVLAQEELLFDPEDDTATLHAFIIFYAGLLAFSPWLISRYFPGLASNDDVEEHITNAISWRSICDSTRPEQAVLPEAPQPADSTPVFEETADAGQATALEKQAYRYANAGNHARAAILWAQTARIRTEHTASAWQQARDNLWQLCEQIVGNIATTEVNVETWRNALWPLVMSTRSARFNPEARLLYDLQKACLASQEKIFEIGPLAWVSSLFKRPFVRALPLRRSVRVIRHTSSARKRLVSSTLSAADRDRLEALLGRLFSDVVSPTRKRFRTLIEKVFENVGLTSDLHVEKIGRHKLIEELLDIIVRRGFITLGNLRDAIATNDLKLPHLSLRDFFRGDALLRADAQLALDLDGVYRRGEFYLRLLQRLSAVGFGTRAGRFLTRFAILPFGGSFVILEGLQHMLAPLLKWTGQEKIHLVYGASIVSLGLVIGGLIHSPQLRNLTLQAVKGAGSCLRWLTVTLPMSFIKLHWVQRVIQSRPFRIAWRFFFKPLFLSGLLWMAIPLLGGNTLVSGISAGVLFLGMNGFLNSRLGRRIEEAIVDWVITGWRAIRHRIIPGLLAFVIDTFKRFMDRLERTLYRVDEWLRLRGQDGRMMFALKLVTGLVWSAIAYLIRIYVTLLVEPQVNPVKHFPVVTVSHKIILPFTIPLTEMASQPLTPLLGEVGAKTIAGGTVFLLPGVFGFLVWEFKSNWQLFALNRVATLQPEIVGRHSETMLRLMKRGFHSGTLPKLYSKLRHAASKGKSREVEHWRERLNEVTEDLTHFVERSCLQLLKFPADKALSPIEVGAIHLSSNRIRIALEHPDYSAQGAVVISFDDTADGLRAGVLLRGWVSELPQAMQQRFRRALIGLYQRAGASVLRETKSHLDTPLAHGVLTYETWCNAWENEPSIDKKVLLPNLKILPENSG